MSIPVGDEVARCLVTAMLVESTVSPKPGLVDKLHKFHEMDILNFQASSVAFYRWFRLAAISGSRHAWRGRLGNYILNAVEDMLRVQDGGNTHLGALLLSFPLSCAAGVLGSRNEWRKTEKLRRTIKKVLKTMDWRDCTCILRSIAKISPRGLGRVPFLDVNRQETYKLIENRKATILDVFRPYEKRDEIIGEYINNYSLTFDVCLKSLKSWLKKTNDIEISSINALLEVMSKRPDTHISKKSGIESARIVMELSRRVLKAGGAATRDGQRMLNLLDEYLRKNDFRPGSSADVLCASLAVLFLQSGRLSRKALL